MDNDKAIDANIKNQHVIFSVKNKKQFDLDQLKKAFKEHGFPKVTVLEGPK